MPAMMLENLKSTKYNWSFQGVAEPQLNDRTFQHDRGKVLGGSSTINGMVYIRGHAMDYDGWAQAGCDGWSFADVLPYFKRLETYEGGADDFRGGSGPLHVHRPTPKDPLTLAFLQAAAEAGHPMTDDICGYQQEGFGVLDRTTHKGERWGTARGYLAPARDRPNLTVVTHAHVERIVIEDRKATGVVYKDKQGSHVTASVDGMAGEVILSAGAVGTPHIMMLSGVGPARHLQELGIQVVADLPGVGANLHDHPDFVMKYRCLQPVTLWPYTKGIKSIVAGAQWLLTGEGVCGSNHFDAVGVVRSAPHIEYPDLQLCMSPIAMDGLTWEPMQEHAFQVHVGLFHTHSRGRLELQNSDPSTAPRILVNYLQDSRDREAMRRGIRIVRELLDQPAFAALCGDEVFPGRHAQSDSDLDEHLNTNTYSQWHLVGTARMGSKDDPEAVVDADGRVYGIDRLRVADASIMPAVPNCNTNAPTIMIAEKLSDAILGQAPLDRSEVKIWQRSHA
eukprot:gnl/MRDRNA2_/MRDRNA2_78280_c0_seq3.p1 gnl/MRDRNA2_/MRDRNA2_78280_c0~~gnl/MRDRNA2_/MRDRNA2_78280_c0_seq3.p1  ORF type:complete len:580 (-),score=102.04 gnl/MRDRNA2_/MRDRNA2_78280_c0_seq3:335-1852(-)